MISKVLIVTSEPFPYGMAGTNRVISLARGIIDQDRSAEVVTYFKYTEYFAGNKQLTARGLYDGIDYSCLFKASGWLGGMMIKIFGGLLRPVKVFTYSLRRIDEKTLVIYYGDKTWPAISLRIAGWIKKSLVIKDETEHPFIRSAHIKGPSRYYYPWFHYRHFDALLVITNYLREYFVNDLKFIKPVQVVPMIVDLDRFPVRNNVTGNSIVFSGEIDDKKEGITALISAYSSISSRYPDLNLDLYGSPVSVLESQRLNNLIKDLSLEGKVTVHGYRNRDEMNTILMNAKMFVFTRPPSLQATYGFSTKLGEYFATGKPVVLTNVGEVGNYFTDNVNAFVCTNEPACIAGKITEVLDNYSYALEVGLRGRETVLKYFNNKSEAGKILDTCESLQIQAFGKNNEKTGVKDK